MICPDCKIEMMKFEWGVFDGGAEYQLDEPYYRCPKCGIEVEEDE